MFTSEDGKILEAKHNSTPELYLKKKLNILVKRKKSHYLADFNERMISEKPSKRPNIDEI